MKAFINSVGLQAPGLEGWQDSAAILRGERPYQFQPLSPYSPAFLPANERRRTTDTIRLGLRSAQDTLGAYLGEMPASIPTLFACVDGDTEISAKMTAAILADEPMVSPIHFHNSVHNAPAGYWMIGQKNRAPSSSISVGEYQLANSFVEAITQLSEGWEALLLVMYDLPIDPIIETYQPDMHAFGVGFLLSLNQNEHTLAELNLQVNQQACPSPSPCKWFGANQSAQVLPLLKGLARGEAGEQICALSPALSLRLHWTPIA
ncbi:MAG: beta-ketoacyl synthase chain length factor [Thiomicrospira sp.]